MKTKRLAVFRILSFVVGLIVGSAASGQSGDLDLRSAFGQAYERYEAAFAASDITEASVAAEEALALGVELFGELHFNTASLRQNHALMLELRGLVDEARAEYLKALDALEASESLAAVPILSRLAGLEGEPAQAEYLQRALAIQRASAPDDVVAYAELAVDAANLLTRTAPGRELAGEILRTALDDLEEVLGDASPELVPVLLALGEADAEVGNAKPQLQWSERALELIEQAFPDDPLVRANVALEIGTDLLYESQSSSSESYLEDALRIYEEVLGLADERTAVAAMLLGEALFARGSLRRAEPPLLTSLEFFAGKRAYQAQELRVRTMLSESYLLDGKSDEATPHLIEIGHLTVFSETQEYLPIYKVPPVYPPRAAVRGLDGYVVVQYTVTPTGETEDIAVVESSNDIFDSAALASARRYRYIPRVVDGEPVEVPGVVTKIIFQLER